MTQSARVQVETQSYSQGTNAATGSTFRKWNVKDTEGNWYSKIVKPDFESNINEGDQVEVKYNQKGNFKNIVEVVPLSDETSPPRASVKTKLQITKDTVAQKATNVAQSSTTKSTYTDNSAGQRNGMITGRAVELAIARGETDLEGMQQAALDVKALADFVEKQK